MSGEVRKEILGMSTVTYKSQITIPKKVRERFKLGGGDSLVFADEGGKLVLAKSTEYR